jgi:hypothetical protein
VIQEANTELIAFLVNLSMNPLLFQYSQPGDSKGSRLWHLADKLPE